MSDSKLALYLAAEKYRVGKLYARALKKYEQILEIDADDLGILKKTAMLYGEVNEPLKQSQIYLAMARINRAREKFDVAEQLCDKALQANADNGEAKHLKAELKALKKSDALERKGITMPIELPPPRLKTPLFKGLTEEELDSIVEAMTPLKIQAGFEVFREGDTNDSLYIIEQGSFEITTSTEEGGSKKETVFNILGPGHFFGEFAFLTGNPRVATVRAKEDSLVFQLTREDLEKVIKQFPDVEKRLFLFYRSRALDLVLAKSPLFNEIPPSDRQALLELFVLKKYAAGEKIIAEGQEDDNLFLIKKGEVRVETKDPEGHKVLLNTLSKNQFFGEISFLTGRPRTADVIAATECELLLIGKEDLQAIVKRYPAIASVLEKFQQTRALSTLDKMKLNL